MNFEPQNGMLVLVYGRLKVTDVKGILDEIQALEKEI